MTVATGDVPIYGFGLCAVPDCGKDIPFGVLMCRRHWFKVPASIRDEVVSAWRQWQQNRISLHELRRVQEAAIAAVAP